MHSPAMEPGPTWLNSPFVGHLLFSSRLAIPGESLFQPFGPFATFSLRTIKRPGDAASGSYALSLYGWRPIGSLYP
jgi:hypothetical protein